MLMPKKVKYRKRQKGRLRGKANRGSRVQFGEFGLKALEPGRISNRQIEAARIAITRYIKRGGKVWDPHLSRHSLYEETGGDPHGQGKGSP